MCDCGEEEIWKVINDEGYKVSSCGRVKDEGDNIVSVKKGMVRFPNKSCRVARVVASAFLENPEKLPVVKRKIRDAKNNHATNLFWSSCAQNVSAKKRQENKFPIEQWSITGEFLKTWDYRSEILENIPRASMDSIRQCFLGKRLTHAGYIWKKGDDSVEGETWKKVQNKKCPSLSAVSDIGRVKTKNGEISYGSKDEHGGYMKINSILVHRLVAEAFCEGYSEDCCVVNHKNKDRTDNRAENLEWVSHAHNSRHSYFSKEDRDGPSSLRNLEGEIWKDIETIPGYRVSNKGRIVGVENFPLKYWKRASMEVSIKGKHHRVKRLVALAFVPNPDNKKNVHCVDGNIENVCSENLQWCNRGEEKGRAPQRAPKKDRIVQLSMEGEILGYWNSKEEAAAKVAGTSKTGIEYTLRKKYPSCGGYLWKWEKSFDLPGEIWKNVELKGKKYTASSLGRILTTRGTKTYGSLNMDGYHQYNAEKVHRIVATAFLPPPLPSQTIINHIDGVKSNNKASNLEWVTPSRNIRHAHETGLVSLPDRS
nr:HNH endonuclease [Marseillevirus futianmevirus]